MFGFRGWHDDDLGAIDQEDFEILVQTAVRYEDEARKQAEAR